jgi:hypothetical protein
VSPTTGGSIQRRPAATIVLAIQSSHAAACDSTTSAESLTGGELLAMLQWLPRDAEQLAMESGCQGPANVGSTRPIGRVAGWTCILAPGETTCRAGN